MARLVRPLPDPACAHEPGGVDPPKITFVIFGGSGRTGTTASMNCAVAAYQSSMQRSPPVHQRGSGACPDTRRSNRPCATTTSTHSVSHDSMSLSQLNPVEPPWYATRMPGGVGGVAPRGVPLSRSSTRCSHSLRDVIISLGTAGHQIRSKICGLKIFASSEGH